MLSVVIPALNEAEHIGAAVASAWAAGAGEVVVVDGGSVDDTVERASAAGADLLQAPRGRAVQMNAGAAHARGDVLLFLHADTTLPAGAAVAIARAMQAPETLGGCFRLRFDARGPLFSVYEWVTRRNVRWIVFGDRALFVRREAFWRLGGFQPIAAFEDVELVRRLGRAGRFRFLDLAVTTSVRRFLKDGVFRRQWRNTSLYVRYRLGANPDRLAKEYTYERENQNGQ